MLLCAPSAGTPAPDEGRTTSFGRCHLRDLLVGYCFRKRIYNIGEPSRGGRPPFTSTIGKCHVGEKKEGKKKQKRNGRKKKPVFPYSLHAHAPRPYTRVNVHVCALYIITYTRTNNDKGPAIRRTYGIAFT
jgi:hypothetical protein